MLIVGNCIVSEDVAERRFSCCLARCKGACCVEGDCGAPLEESELPILRRLLPAVEPYMTEAGKAVVRAGGVSDVDNDLAPCTPLVNGRECAYVAWGDDGTAFCAFEQAFRDGKTDWMKPVSCHLYPIRVDNYGEFLAVNFHDWEVCHPQPPLGCGSSGGGIPLYRFLQVPLVRRFGQAWYDELLDAVEAFEQRKRTKAQ